MNLRIDITDNYRWTNEHNSVSKQVLRRFQISNDPATGWKHGLAGIQTMIGQARARNECLRSYGGAWSLSEVAICSDSIHDSKPLTYYGSVGRNSIIGTPLFKDDPKHLSQRLFYVQSGCQINQINNVFEKSKGVCLPTTGASTGQTIAGAVSTGTHGSALNIGAMQDYVRAIHIVKSETEHAMIQPKSNPIVKRSFSDVFGAKLITDDQLFHSALVSFGSFGVIHGIILESVSLFMLETYCVRVDYRAVESLYSHLVNFDQASSRNLTGFLKQLGLPSNQDPYHLDMIINPYSSDQNTFLRVMYKHEYDAQKLSPEPGGGTTRVGDDVLSLLGSVSDSAEGFVEGIVYDLFESVATVQAGFTQTPRNIFGDSTIYKPKKGGTSTELGVPIDKAAGAVRLVMAKARRANFAGLLGIRFVKKSPATLAFTRFSPLTCTIALPGFNSESTQNFYRKVFSEMDYAGIPFTLHWGQEGDFSPKRLMSMYGNAVNTWIDARNAFLNDPMERYMFTNDFLRRCGLSDAPALIGGDVIV